MKSITRLLTLGLAGALVSAGSAVAQTTDPTSEDWPSWAYGFLTPLDEGDRVALPCPLDANPRSCRHPTAPEFEDGIKHSLPDTDLKFTAREADNGYGPADWYPGDHPEMPDIVRHGNEAAGVRACSLCHYPNGQGKMENAHVAGLPAAYILQQLDLFETGDRKNSDPRKGNTNEMARMPARLTDEEKQQIAEYFSSMPFRQWVRVVETDRVPTVRITNGGLMVPLEDEPLVPIGNNIIEVPEHPERMEVMRDPRSGFITYVPLGSLAKGEELVTTGGGKTIQCGLCHGPGMQGLGDIPGIAGRTASYTMRQLWDIKQGTRRSNGIMEPVVQNLSAEDLRNIVAYLASLPP
jgi:cytochrome c553